MHSLSCPSSLLSSFPSLHHSHPPPPLQKLGFCFNGNPKITYSQSFHSLSFSAKLMVDNLHKKHSSITAALPADESTVSTIDFEDFNEKDWSFLDSMDSESTQNTERIIKAGEISETSRVLVSMGSEGFVDRLVESSPSQLLLVVHDSLFVLACVKEKYDDVKCWQGELNYLPDKWSQFDVLFLYYLPAMPFKLDQVLETLAKRCSSGARLVISHPQGREALEQQKKQFPDVVVSDLPEKMNLQDIAKQHSFELAEFVDEPGLYLAVLKYC